MVCGWRLVAASIGRRRYLVAENINLTRHDCYLKKSRISAKILKTEGLGEKQIIYMKLIKNTLMPHGRNIYDKAYSMAKETMCAY